jgi:hypothetical protein
MSNLALYSSDSGDFFALPENVRGKIEDRLSAIERILKSTIRRGAAIAAEAQTLGVCAAAIRGWITRYNRSGGDWRALVDRRMVGHEDFKLPDVFIGYWKGLCEGNQRKCRPAWRKLIRDWKAGKPVPGYDITPRPEINGLPRGWSYGNLMRFKPSKFELVLARQGPIAASELLPLTFTTRVGLLPGQYYFFDDLWHDLKTTVHWKRSTVIPLELACHDLCCALKVKYGLKPMLRGDDGKREGLRDENMRYLIATVLTQIGVNRSGFFLGGEHGTAAIAKDMEELLIRFSPVPCGVLRSGIQGHHALAGGFPGLGRGTRRDDSGNRVGFYSKGLGNFRFKASLESSHNLVHNETADLPGQTGHDRNAPEQLVGLEREWDHLWVAMQAMTPEQAAMIEGRLLSFDQFARLYREIDRRIQTRTEHRLEGWRESGFMASCFRLSLETENWQPMAKLLDKPERERAAIEAFIYGEDGYVTDRRMSPYEAFCAKADLVKFPLWLVPSILGAKLKTGCRVQDTGEIIVRDQEISDDPIRYLAMAQAQDGRIVPLNGEFDAWINPFDQSLLFICESCADGVGAYVGTCKLREKITRGDEEALVRSWNENRKANHAALQGPRRRGLEKLRDEKDRLERQTKALTDKPVTEAAREYQEYRDSRKGRKSAPKNVTTPAAVTTGAVENNDEEVPNFGALLPNREQQNGTHCND